MSGACPRAATRRRRSSWVRVQRRYGRGIAGWPLDRVRLERVRCGRSVHLAMDGCDGYREPPPSCRAAEPRHRDGVATARNCSTNQRPGVSSGLRSAAIGSASRLRCSMRRSCRRTGRLPMMSALPCGSASFTRRSRALHGRPQLAIGTPLGSLGLGSWVFSQAPSPKPQVPSRIRSAARTACSVPPARRRWRACRCSGRSRSGPACSSAARRRTSPRW